MINDFLARLLDFWPKIYESLQETSIMMLFAAVAAILLGIPIGILIYLSSEGKPLHQHLWARILNTVLNLLINIIRSFPFLLLVVAMQPLIRATYGRATGDPIAASFPMMVIATALYARFVEQSLLEIPRDVLELAESLGATVWQVVKNFLLIEARSSLVIGFTSAFVSFISYSTIMGVVGGGGIGDFAIRYGYQRYEEDMMYAAIIIIILFVQIIQWLGYKLAQALNHK